MLGAGLLEHSAMRLPPATRQFFGYLACDPDDHGRDPACEPNPEADDAQAV